MSQKKVLTMKQTRVVAIQLEVRSENENEMYLEGYAATFDNPTCLYEIDGVTYNEVIDRGAFDSMNSKDCCLKYNHSNNVPILARTRGGSLELEVDSVGLKFKARLFNTQAARDVYELVKQGGLDKCSFAFTIKEESYDRETRTRHIKSVDKLFDVAVVDVPAYDSTSVNARSFFELENEKERIALEKAKLKKELILKTFL